MGAARESGTGPGTRRQRRLFFAILVVSTTAGCSAPPVQPGDSPVPSKVVVMAPAAAEMLESLGLTHVVVGIGEYGPWPRGIADLPEVGGYSMPNIERVLSLGADLLISTQSQAAVAAHRKLESLGVEVLALDTSTYDGVFLALERLGRVFARESEALQIAGRLRREISAVEQQARGLAQRRVLFVVGRDPLYVAGPGSHIDRLITLAGGANVAHDLAASYQEISVEAVLERLPEVIIDTSNNRVDAPLGRRAGPWGQWPFLPAVGKNQVLFVHPSRLVIPGIRLPEMARLMGRLIHPETFGPLREEDFGPLEVGQPPPAGQGRQ